jgi:hydrogenase nickel incorporation protein HypA/HybF
MHELSIAVGIVEAVIGEAEARGLGTVSSVYVRLGVLSGVNRDALLFSYPIACEETVLCGSRLEIEDVPVTITCISCRTESPAAAPYHLQCPSCGGFDTRVVQGRELELRAFEAAEEVHT